MSENKQHRHGAGARQAGVKMGGKFAQQRRTEASGRGLAPEAHDEHRAVLEHEMVELDQHLRNMWRNSGDFDRVISEREDIHQDTMVRMFEKARKDRLTNLAQDHGGLARVMLRQEQMRRSNNDQSSRELAGRGRLAERRRELETELGRELGRREYEALADEVRESFPPGRRPAPDYHFSLSQVVTSDLSEDGFEDGQIDLRPFIAREDEYRFEQTPEDGAEAFDRATERLESKSATRHDLKADLWGVMREADDQLPATQRMTANEASAARKVLKAARDGAFGAAARFVDGESTPAEEQALFAPFGGKRLSPAQRLAVASKLSEHADFGHHIWNSAVLSSTKQASTRQAADPASIEEF
ncbi:hypothetical protein ACXR2T_10275 [Leucobacter sp. HY1910]